MTSQYHRPVTELSNALTSGIDVATNEDIVKILHEADKEIFEGWDGSMGVLSEELLHTIESLQKVISDVLKEQDTRIILSGCGTSGRLAFMIAKYFNGIRAKQGQSEAFDYLIAGHDKALFTSQEAPEDNPATGRRNLIDSSSGSKRVIYIGITCGLSAAYVAGQLDYCMENLDVFTPVLIGFNPTYLAKKNYIENWDKTFASVSKQLELLVKENKGFILNPIIGPEPITGSTRMKSGSATKIILECVMIGAIDSSFKTAKMLLNSYQKVQMRTYSNVGPLAQAVNIAGESLLSGGHIYYVGQNRLGIVGMIDASECPPTYGATFDDIRGFAGKGYETLGNKEGQLSIADISLSYFDDKLVPLLSPEDTAIFLLEDGAFNISQALRSSAARKVLINFTSGPNQEIPRSLTDLCDVVVSLPSFEDCLDAAVSSTSTASLPLLMEMSCKWMCNIISTGAHIKKGKVFENTMVDVRVSNNKLYYRAVGIVEKYSRVSIEDAETNLLKSIYKSDEITSDIRERPISAHIEIATGMEKVVPVALLLAITGCTCEEAHKELARSPAIRSAIAKFIKT